MFTLTDTFVPVADYVATIEHATWVSAMDATEHDWTPEPEDYAPATDQDWEDFWATVEAPAHDDESNHVIINHYRGE